MTTKLNQKTVFYSWLIGFLIWPCYLIFTPIILSLLHLYSLGWLHFLQHILNICKSLQPPPSFANSERSFGIFLQNTVIVSAWMVQIWISIWALYSTSWLYLSIWSHWMPCSFTSFFRPIYRVLHVHMSVSCTHFVLYTKFPWCTPNLVFWNNLLETTFTNAGQNVKVIPKDQRATFIKTTLFSAKLKFFS